jgi:hypothetical protein
MRTKWRKLKEDDSRLFKDKIITEGAWNVSENMNNIWREMTTHIWKVPTEVFGATKRNKRETKDT